jgi:multimeric flavodoxin WrbA
MSDSSKPFVSVVYHSGYGHTAKVAESVRQGVQEGGAEVLMVKVEDVDGHWDDLARADGILFGAPTYMGSASAPFKEFMDKTSEQWFEFKWKDKLAGGFTNSGSQSGDKSATLFQFATLAAQHGMVWVSLGMMPGNNSTQGSEQDLNRLGFFLGLGTQANTDEGPEETPPASDLETARLFGVRFAEACARWKNGA